MGDEVNPAVLKATQGSLGKYVKRPPLTEKLLSRPPFKYLHDIFSAVVKNTGFMEGLFSGSETNPDNFKDRDSKILFLDKVVRMVGLVNGKEVPVKPSAIVAGKEAERTNLLLQELAAAIGAKVKNAEYVQRVLNGEGPTAAAKKSREEGKEKQDKDRREDSKDRQRDDKKDRREDSKDRQRDDKKDKRKEDKDDGSKDRRRRDQRDDAGRDKDKDRPRDSKGKDRADRDRDRSKGGDKADDKERRRGGGRGDDKKPQASTEDSGQKGSKDEEDDGANRIPRPSSAKGNRRLRDGRRAAHNDDVSEEEMQRKSKADREDSAGGGRAPSAKPAPRVKGASGAAAGAAGGPGGGVGIDDGSGKRVTGVIIERDVDSDDDQFVVEEAPPTLLSGGGGLDEENENEEEVQDEQHGGLVKGMLKSKQEFKEAGGKGAGGKTVMTTTDANRRREKAATAKEIERLKQQLQGLTREANPLGKVIDFVQEDLDSMAKELERWRAETKEVMVRLKQEQSSSDVSLNGLRLQLAELDQAEKDKLELIATVKANIVRNDERIAKMIEAMSRS